MTDLLHALRSVTGKLLGFAGADRDSDVSGLMPGGVHQSVWDRIGVDDEGFEWNVQRGSVHRAGAYVRSIVKYIAPEPMKSPTRRKRCDYFIGERIDDLDAKTFSLLWTAFARSDGEVVEVRRYNGAAAQEYPVEPGSTLEKVAKHVGDLASQAAALAAGVTLADVESGAWQRVEPDPDECCRISVLVSSGRREADVIQIATRTDYARAQNLWGGRTYSAVVDLLRFYGKAGVHAAASSDYYDDDGVLIFTRRQLNADQFLQAERGTATDRIRQIAEEAVDAAR